MSPNLRLYPKSSEAIAHKANEFYLLPTAMHLRNDSGRMLLNKHHEGIRYQARGTH